MAPRPISAFPSTSTDDLPPTHQQQCSEAWLSDYLDTSAHFGVEHSPDDTSHSQANLHYDLSQLSMPSSQGPLYPGFNLDIPSNAMQSQLSEQYYGPTSFRPQEFHVATAYTGYHPHSHSSLSESSSPISESPALDDIAPTMTWPSSPEARQPAGNDTNNSHSDQPYSQLIYQALLQAPGQRMMLREIYDWFQAYTQKPRDSGTKNGWQNSIRHNLSMNKAFENDKAESSSSKGRAKKSNSVWMLTEEAIRTGVKSTTRYRKTGSAKRSNTNKTPAVQRQQSGSKGGRAARAASRLRKAQQSGQAEWPASYQPTSQAHHYEHHDTNASMHDSDYPSIYTPVTPPDEGSFLAPPVPSATTYPGGEAQYFKSEVEGSSHREAFSHDFSYGMATGSSIGETWTLHPGRGSPQPHA